MFIKEGDLGLLIQQFRAKVLIKLVKSSIWAT